MKMIVKQKITKHSVTQIKRKEEEKTDVNVNNREEENGRNNGSDDLYTCQIPKTG